MCMACHNCCGDDYDDTLDVLRIFVLPAGKWIALEPRCQHMVI